MHKSVSLSIASKALETSFCNSEYSHGSEEVVYVRPGADGLVQVVELLEREGLFVHGIILES